MIGFLKFCKRDWMKVNYTSEVTGYKYEMKTAVNVYAEMRANLPPTSLAFRNKFSYKEDMDIVYSIIQPSIDSNFVNPEQKKILEDAIFIMIENGISFAAGATPTTIATRGGLTRRAIYEPQFEKYMVYGVRSCDRRKTCQRSSYPTLP